MLLQKNIIKKYLTRLGEEETREPWERYQVYFLNPDIQENIHKIKEEQFQEGFLRELFVGVLGYTINPSPDYNLTTEQKNEVGSKKADGAILMDGKVIGVIELKDQKTPDLSSIETQAFGYKNKHRDTRLVIISNFEKLRLYIDNAVEYREWDIFHMTHEEFCELYLCLAWSQVAAGTVLQMKQESISSEYQITKALYRDYSQFKRALFADILANNPVREGADKKEWQLLLFKKTQKLLDRLLFIFFAEDCALLPPNSMVQIIDQWETLKDIDAYVPFYERVKKYFGYMNTGFKGKKYEIFAYNGGLFKPDEVLDNLTISDNILAEHTRKLSAYDFESDVDVNILGHIFENSLSEIEEVTQQITNGQAPQTSKRKQDGGFYTPQYITKYIVENTVGRLCEEKKKELNIIEEEYNSEQRRQLKTKQRLLDQLKAYREWLLQLTILDPACGSGAFLNAALRHLIKEHKQVDELEKKVLGYSLEFHDVENYILENNLFGVDINEESVGIAQLALWLRTAKPHRKLNSLNENIKCGNSLISDPAVAGDKAFNWQEQFPKVFENGGFDVVIGNPPYVRQELIQDQIPALKNYEVYAGKADLYTYFYERAEFLLKKGGLLGFICSGKFFEANYGKTLVDFLYNHFKFIQVIDYDDLEVFKGVSAYPLIFIASKIISKIESYNFNYCYVPSCSFNSLEEITQNLPFVEINSVTFHDSNYKFLSRQDTAIMEKLSQNSVYLNDLGYAPLVGVKTGFNEGYMSSNSINEYIKPYIFGRNIKKYSPPIVESKIVFPYNSTDNGYCLVNEDCEALDYLRPYESKLRQRAIIKEGLINGSKTWYEYQQINRLVDFSKEYIVYPNVSLGANFTLSKGNVIDMTGFIIPTNDRFLLAILNSSIAVYVMNLIAITRRGGYQEYKVQYLNQIPIKVVEDSAKQPFIALADSMLNLNSQLQEKRSKFLRRLTENFENLKITTALQQFDQLDFRGLMSELKKQKIKLTLLQQDEWEDYFTERIAECQELLSQIKATDQEIDTRVFDLYGLTEGERQIVIKNTEL